jgi:hypothetical protein
MKPVNCILGLIALSMVSCMNMPTPSSAVSTPHASTEPYEYLDCPHLATEYERSNRTEKELTLAQEKRVSASVGHSLFYGWGRGDGMETVELAKVRGERDALRRTQSQKGCLGR